MFRFFSKVSYRPKSWCGWIPLKPVGSRVCGTLHSCLGHLPMRSALMQRLMPTCAQRTLTSRSPFYTWDDRGALPEPPSSLYHWAPSSASVALAKRISCSGPHDGQADASLWEKLIPITDACTYRFPSWANQRAPRCLLSHTGCPCAGGLCFSHPWSLCVQGSAGAPTTASLLSFSGSSFYSSPITAWFP